jgi:hypothetical protein
MVLAATCLIALGAAASYASTPQEATVPKKEASAAATATTPTPAAADSPRQLVKDLLDPDKRSAALEKLILLNRYESSSNKPIRVNQVVVCPQPKGEPLVAVFKDEGYAGWSGAGPGKAAGHVLLFDSEGKYVPYYHNANAPFGVFADVNGDGLVESVQSGFVGLQPAATLLYVIPIVEKPMPLLCVAYNPEHRETATWAWQVADARKDGVLQIQLGPVVKILGDPAHSLEDNGTNKEINPTVTFTWDKAKKAYVGPAGGDDQPFKRLDPEKDVSEQLKVFDTTPDLKLPPPAGAPVAFDIVNGYWVSKQFAPNEAASFVVFRDQKAFQAAFGVQAEMGTSVHPLPKDAFETRMVVAAVKREKDYRAYTVQAVTVEAGVLTLQYNTTGFARSRSAPDSMDKSNVLIISVPKGDYAAIKFVEDGKVVKKLDLAAPPAAANP